MKKTSLLLVILFLIATAFNPHAGKWLIPPVEKAMSYNDDSIANIIRCYKGAMDNNYYVADTAFDALIKKIEGFDKMHLYNINGMRVLLMPDDACGSPVLSPAFSADANIYKEVEGDKLDDALKTFVPIGHAKPLIKDYPTAILYWNKTMGQRSSDNIFAWEKAFREKFRDKINIIKVNTDVQDIWREEKKEKYLALFDKLLIATAADR